MGPAVCVGCVSPLGHQLMHTWYRHACDACAWDPSRTPVPPALEMEAAPQLIGGGVRRRSATTLRPASGCCAQRMDPAADCDVPMVDTGSSVRRSGCHAPPCRCRVLPGA